FISDKVVRGLKLRVTQGSKSFVLERKHRGKTRRVTLGQWPTMNVLMARELATRMLAQLAQGIDPAEASKPIKVTPTFGSIFDAYLEDRTSRGRKSAETMRRIYQRHLAHWNERKANDIQRIDVSQLHGQIGAAYGQVIANRVVTLLRA